MRRSDARCASGSFFGGCRRESAAPGAASAARAGVRFSFAGRSAVLRRGRCGPALLRVAPKMQLPCRRLRRPRRVLRHGPAASCSAPMASQVSVSGTPGDASPGPATASVAATGPASIKDFSCPVVPRESSEGLAKLPHCRALRFAPVAPHGARGESVPDAGASPRRLQNALASRKRHLGVGNHHPWLPRQRRISAGCLGSQSVGAPSDHAAIQRQRSAFSVPLAPKRHHRRVLSSPLSACAPGRFSPPSLPDCHAARVVPRTVAETLWDSQVVTWRRKEAACHANTNLPIRPAPRYGPQVGQVGISWVERL